MALYEMDQLEIGGLRLQQAYYDQVYYVDANDGDDANDGLSMDAAKLTYDAARTLSNATISWSSTPKRPNLIIMAAGTYAELFCCPYYAVVIGLPGYAPGPDSSVKFKPAAGSAIAESASTNTKGATFLASSMYNLWFETADATPIARINTFQGSLFENCMFYSGGSSTYGIDMGVAPTTGNPTGMKSSIIRNCRFASGSTVLTHGIYFRGGNNVFFHNSVVEGCNIRASTAGIWIQDTCTATIALILENFIARPTKGIDDNSGGSYCVRNRISATTDAIEHANSSSRCIDNSVIDNVTANREHTYE